MISMISPPVASRSRANGRCRARGRPKGRAKARADMRSMLAQSPLEKLYKGIHRLCTCKGLPT